MKKDLDRKETIRRIEQVGGGDFGRGAIRKRFTRIGRQDEEFEKRFRERFRRKSSEEELGMHESV
jgi:hypothetical protein